MTTRLVLASNSPRRAALLSQLGLSFEVSAADLPEDYRPGESPEEHAERLAREKARAVAKECPDALVVAGDTVVVGDAGILGKPQDEEEAVAMLCSLAGRTHTVLSGLALLFPSGRIRSGCARAQVTFRSFGEDFARGYVATGEPMDKAGAYGIQGLGGALVREVRGDYHTVVGLSISLFLDLLEAEGWRYRFGRLRAPQDPPEPESS